MLNAANNKKIFFRVSIILLFTIIIVTGCSSSINDQQTQLLDDKDELVNSGQPTARLHPITDVAFTTVSKGLQQGIENQQFHVINSDVQYSSLMSSLTLEVLDGDIPNPDFSISTLIAIFTGYFATNCLGTESITVNNILNDNGYFSVKSVYSTGGLCLGVGAHYGAYVFVEIDKTFSPISFDVKGSKYLSQNEVSRIEIPLVEPGYGSLVNTVIRSSAELDQFKIDISNYQYWNNKDAFTSALNELNIDFASHNVVIFPYTIGTGGVALIPQDPLRIGDKILIYINSDGPGNGTGIEVFYAFAYKVSKAITDVIIIVDNDSRIEISTVGM